MFSNTINYITIDTFSQIDTHTHTPKHRNIHKDTQLNTYNHKHRFTNKQTHKKWQKHSEVISKYQTHAITGKLT